MERNRAELLVSIGHAVDALATDTRFDAYVLRVLRVADAELWEAFDERRMPA